MTTETKQTETEKQNIEAEKITQMHHVFRNYNELCVVIEGLKQGRYFFNANGIALKIIGIKDIEPEQASANLLIVMPDVKSENKNQKKKEKKKGEE